MVLKNANGFLDNAKEAQEMPRNARQNHQNNHQPFDILPRITHIIKR
jgi:hypothetical protein